MSDIIKLICILILIGIVIEKIPFKQKLKIKIRYVKTASDYEKIIENEEWREISIINNYAVCTDVTGTEFYYEQRIDNDIATYINECLVNRNYLIAKGVIHYSIRIWDFCRVIKKIDIDIMSLLNTE